MTFTQFIPILTLIASLFGAWITIRITIAELKKDISHLQEKLELITTTRNEHEKQSKDDMKELKDDMKKIFFVKLILWDFKIFSSHRHQR